MPETRPRRGCFVGVTFRGAVSMRPRRRDATSDQEIVELAALADGSLAPERRAELEARVASSSELAALLAEQERAVSFARTAAAEVDAPETLRARIPTGSRSMPKAASARTALCRNGGSLAR